MVKKNNCIEVVCAIIQNNSRTLVTQRPCNKHLADKWEFPGGKIETGETYEQALIREISEELNVEIEICKALTPNRHSYDDFSVNLIPFICGITKGQLKLTEHQNHIWATDNELLDMDWAAADLPILDDYLKTRGVE